MDNPRAALPGWCSASGRLSRTGPLKRSARRLSDVGLGTSGIGAERSWEYRFNPCENRLTPRQNAQQIPDERELGTRPSFHHVSTRVSSADQTSMVSSPWRMRRTGPRRYSPARSRAWSCGRISSHSQRRSHTSSWGEWSRRRSHSQAYAWCKTASEAISSIQSTGRPPAGGVDDSPSGSYHMAGGGVPEWLKGPVSKTGVAVARFGLIDRSNSRRGDVESAPVISAPAVSCADHAALAFSFGLHVLVQQRTRDHQEAEGRGA